MSKNENTIWRIIISILLFLLIDQLFENIVVFNGLNVLYNHTELSQNMTNYLFKFIEIFVVLIVNYFVTKQKFYFYRRFRIYDAIFIILIILFLFLRIRSLDGHELLDGILTGLAGGIPEELLVRGVVMGKLLEFTTKNKSSYLRILLAVVPSTFIFGLLHLNNIGQSSMIYLVAQVMIAASSGLVFSAIYIRSGSLFYAMLFHFLDDFIIQAGSSTGSTSGAGLSIGDAQSIIWTYAIISVVLFIIILPPLKKTPLLIRKMQRQN